MTKLHKMMLLGNACTFKERIHSVTKSNTEKKESTSHMTGFACPWFQDTCVSERVAHTAAGMH